MMTLQRMFTIVLIGAIAALCVLLSPSERLLLQQATKVTRETTSLENDIVGYRWLSNQEVIVLRYDAQIKPYLVRLNLRDGTETKLPGWPNDVVHISSTAKKLQISPDRQWIFSFPRGIDTSMLFGGRLDGTYPFDYLGADSHVGQVFWLSDSVHCLEIKYDLFTGLTCHRFRVAHPEDTDTQIVSLPASIEHYFEFDLVADHRVLGHQWVTTTKRQRTLRLPIYA